MKRFLLLLLILLFCSCAGEKNIEFKEFDAMIDISAFGSEFKASFEKREAYDKITLLSPAEIAGTEFVLSDGVCTVRCDDLEYESENFKAIFDFLPVNCECEKVCGNRVYRIYDLRGLK